LGVTGPKDSIAAWFWDYDNDGALDLYVTTYFQDNGPKRLRAVAASYLSEPSEAEPAKLYRGDGRGGFRDVAKEQGLARVKTLPMGANFGDLDNDGDQDVFEQMGGAYPGDAFSNVVYENPGFGNQWIVVKLVGARSNRSAIGARIRVEIVDRGQRRSIARWVDSGRSFGGNPLRQHIGLGKAEKVEKIEVHWPTTGTTQTFRNVPVGQLIEIREDGAEIRARPVYALTPT
jgi:hypothetical protein